MLGPRNCSNTEGKITLARSELLKRTWPPQYLPFAYYTDLAFLVVRGTDGTYRMQVVTDAERETALEVFDRYWRTQSRSERRKELQEAFLKKDPSGVGRKAPGTAKQTPRTAK